MLFYKAVQTLKEENPIRVINALHVSNYFMIKVMT